MTRYLLAGGGTAGHVNPLLATADAIREREPDSEVIVLGTKEGLESRLVPERGYELVTIPKVPFPRKLNGAALRFPGLFRQARRETIRVIAERAIDVVVGFGGYASTPAYVAAKKSRVPLVIHEANARPGLANRLGARYTRFVGVAFHGTRLRHARFVGMPLRPEIERIDIDDARREGITFFDLDPERRTLLVTGGSQGARRLNSTVIETAQQIIDGGWQIIHLVGGKADVTDPQIEHYNMVRYCDRMELALAVADFAVSRAGAATVSELTAVGVPAVYVPYPVGNGEQRLNASDVVGANGALLIADALFVPSWVRATLIPLLSDRVKLHDMAVQSRHIGSREGSQRMLQLIDDALDD
ncbi:UDP-N-acetylglucosamine--N-acetylmuramyl-(pentapeptide) pyrophosphoryl-undecaprenol N-acetylglucosamine transferase [Paramicrobacterium agarici]|uniref:UDP-N-acetylglucosamine--N-acetylmuramyl-(pentapeptide) pyrophosphoryl-undecaprenol N-acetylglucosamine transferase n=1 Tax=Paramicrobacterium agarici TaxID=630514 RepID=A0A2A9DYQ9_9MICO|nr:UDP-N-acetylglucosamine--N-acetylmuramyl-(pentapeptide) pyrophosphoryl-undecaprenol N-acetylglucosamine transferase [Microbacterium agarici]PFG31451.1 UDP-N-acetylglucosamine-N-acetylmuramylpentapeptide N-acetylglucosamine transferase [Microbacterium agarici]TQO21339.1 UDP-N-acetylglucosamine-N-acetylmuramylpentapeptide N-acetylglucosamine transferase [Microbacterium agarici]